MEEEGPHAVEMAQEAAQKAQAKDEAQGRRALSRPLVGTWQIKHSGKTPQKSTYSGFTGIRAIPQ